MLAGVVRGDRGKPHLRRDRGVVDDHSTAGRHHVRKFMLHRQEHPARVGAQHVLPVLDGLFVQWGGARCIDPGVVERDVDPAVTGDTCGDEVANFGILAHVGAVERCVSPVERICSWFASPSSFRRPRRSTLAPRLAKAITLACPIPEVAPVISTTVSAKSPFGSALSGSGPASKAARRRHLSRARPARLRLRPKRCAG